MEENFRQTIFAFFAKVDYDSGHRSGENLATCLVEFDLERTPNSALFDPKICDPSLNMPCATPAQDRRNLCHKVRSSRPTGDLPTLDLHHFTLWSLYGHFVAQRIV